MLAKSNWAIICFVERGKYIRKRKCCGLQYCLLSARSVWDWENLDPSIRSKIPTPTFSGKGTGLIAVLCPASADSSASCFARLATVGDVGSSLASRLPSGKRAKLEMRSGFLVDF